MTKEASSTPRELRESSDEDESLVLSICRRPVTSSIQPFNQSLKSWLGPARTHDWTNLPKCMAFIAKNGCSLSRSHIYVRRTLDRLSPTATTEQLNHILNGYADLYKLDLYFIDVIAEAPIDEKNIRIFGGTSSSIEQRNRHRNVAFIMYNAELSLFAPLYVTHSDGHPQTCFVADDEKIIDHIAGLLRQLNQEISQSLAPQTNHNNDNHDAAKNAEKLQTTDCPDTPLTLQPTIENEAVSTASKITEAEIYHDFQTVDQPEFHRLPANDVGALSSTDLTETVRQHLDNLERHLNIARRLVQEVDDVSSMETDDRQLVTAETLEERTLISHNVMTNTAQNKIRRAKKLVRSSKNDHSHTSIDLSKSTTEPTATTHRALLEYDPPNITRQPRSHRRVRMLKDLSNKKTSLVQGGEGPFQRIYPEILVPCDDDQELYIRVRVVTENRYPHPLQTVAPEKAHVDWTLMKDSNERVCLQCDPDSFDPKLECVFLIITPDERRNCRKKIKVHHFNWKQCAPAMKKAISEENLRLCRLEFYYCIRIAPGEYQLVSQPSYTSVIEEADGDVTIDPAQIEPKQLCELGGEKITVPLSVQCPKKGFSIECNGDELKHTEFTMERKKLLFFSPCKVEGIDELHLIIKRTEYAPDSSKRIENQLYEDYLPYVPHYNGQCIHSCSQADLTTNKNQTS